MPTTQDPPADPGTGRERLRELHGRLPAGSAVSPEDLARVLELTERTLADDDAAAAAGEDAAHRHSTRVVVAAAAVLAAVAVLVLPVSAVVTGRGPTAAVVGAGATGLLFAVGAAGLHLRSGAGGHRRRAVLAPVVAAAGTVGVSAAALGAPAPVWFLLLAAALVALVLLGGTVTGRGGAR